MKEVSEGGKTRGGRSLARAHHFEDWWENVPRTRRAIHFEISSVVVACLTLYVHLSVSSDIVVEGGGLRESSN